MAAAGAGAGVKVNSIQSYLAHVLPSLEVMCRDNEVGVRAKAVKALANIGMRMNESEMVGVFIPMVMRLAVDNLATARVSACTLLFVPYETSSMLSMVQHRSAYSAFCQDEDPLVRHEAATNLWRIAVVDLAHFDHDVVQLLQDLASDDDESVRSAALESCGALRDLIEPHVFVDGILPLITAGSEDASLRVREMAAIQMQHLCEVESGGIEDSPPLPQLKATRWSRIPIPTLQSALVVVAVGTFVYGTYHGVSSVKQLVESIKTSGKEAVSQLQIARSFWIVKGCPALINVYPNVFLRK